VLEVLDAAARTHVNARPVREKALLRCGDVVCLGKVTIALKADRDDLIETTVPAESIAPALAQSPSRVILRGVSGSHYGRTIAVNHRIVIGSAGDCGLVIDEVQIAARHAAIENVGDAIYLRNIAAPNGTSVNGVRVTDAIVYPGDQLAFERNHFVVEAPGLPLRGHAAAQAARSITEPMDVIGGDARDEPRRSHGAIWWLIGAAAVIALCLGLLIHRGV
jgi:pSer/pThr/pTyr-binding forkhead associated (FHA) protein